jgi:hypothetical protein
VSLEFTYKRKFIFPEGMTCFTLQYAVAWFKTGVRKFRRSDKGSCFVWLQNESAKQRAEQRVLMWKVKGRQVIKSVRTTHIKIWKHFGVRQKWENKVEETAKLKINNAPIRSKKCRSLHRQCFSSKLK